MTAADRSPREDGNVPDERFAPATEDADLGCCFLLRGDNAVSSGRYQPVGYSLNLRGSDVAQHQVAHLHEIHHKVLNDDTAWGALIHIAARHRGGRGNCFPT